jgi:glycine dehydrogenase subunit 2
MLKNDLYKISYKDKGGAFLGNRDPGFHLNEIEEFTLLDGLRHNTLPLPEVGELDVVRHFTRLSKESYGVDNGFYPLGSCTMKYNPKLNDSLASLDGFRAIHPFQPQETFPGALTILFELQSFIGELTGMDAVSLQPAAGAQGELAGVLIIRKHFETLGETRDVILIADSAHGTNPASAAMAGYHCETIATQSNGQLDVQDLRKKMTHRVAGLMLTNPSTLGIFESQILEIAAIVHERGALLYYDGANMNALMGITRPGDMGFDIVHMNVHKTLSTPHGGGGPGAGPVGVKSFLTRYLPLPLVDKDKNGGLSFKTYDPYSIGRVKNFFGHISVLIRAYCYILSKGSMGLKQASQRAVLNANYLQAELKHWFPPVFDSPCLHECLLSLEKLGFPAESFAKRLIDYGIHPPTLIGGGCVYYPDTLKNSFLIEPTETESKSELDQFVKIMKMVRNEVLTNPDLVESSPHSLRVKRLRKKN